MDLKLRFGAATAGAGQSATGAEFALANPLVWGPETEHWDGGLTRRSGCPQTVLWEREGTLWGMARTEPRGGDFAAAAATVYRQILDAARGMHLHRIWNFVPRINGRSAGGLENYRAFCVGRGAALDAAYGTASESRLPAATGVGTAGEHLAVIFVAGEQVPRHLENPAQVPAYRYPSQYGPRPPSFARGTLIGVPDGTRLYVSGTGAIRHSESLHPGDVAAQCEVVLQNIDLVARSGGLPGLHQTTAGRRWFRVYLRHAEDWLRVRPLLDARLLRDDDAVQVVQADICRTDLLMEIEARVELAEPAQESSQ